MIYRPWGKRHIRADTDGLYDNTWHCIVVCRVCRSGVLATVTRCLRSVHHGVICDQMKVLWSSLKDAYKGLSWPLSLCFYSLLNPLPVFHQSHYWTWFAIHCEVLTYRRMVRHQYVELGWTNSSSNVKSVLKCLKSSGTQFQMVGAGHEGVMYQLLVWVIELSPAHSAGTEDNSFVQLTVGVTYTYSSAMDRTLKMQQIMQTLFKRRATVIRHGLVSTQRQAATTLFHGQEQNLVTEPSLWPAQLYGTVYQQQFVKLTACIRLSASSKLICLHYVLMTDYPFLYILHKLYFFAFVMHSRFGAK